MHQGGKMLEASRKQIKDFANLLRTKLVTDGCHQKYVNSMSDGQILDDFRQCCDCGDEIYSKDQQLHIVLEFDTPERAYEILYETSDTKDHGEDEDDEDEDNALEVTIRGKWLFDGAETIQEAIDLLEDYKFFLESLQADGFELTDPIEDDYGHLQRETK